jgi:hypothetical protein
VSLSFSESPHTPAINVRKGISAWTMLKLMTASEDEFLEDFENAPTV